MFFGKIKINVPTDSNLKWPQNMGLGTFWFINWQKFQPNGPKMKTFILTRWDLSHYGPQKIRLTGRNINPTETCSFLDFCFGPKKRVQMGLQAPKGSPLGPKDPYGGRRPTKWGSGGEAPRKGAHMDPWGPKGRKKLFFPQGRAPPSPDGPI